MRVLIVGAGAVGMVYGRHLAAAGHKVTFFVKKKHVDAVRTGVQMRQLARSGGVVEHWQGDGWLCDVQEVAASAWDQVWLATSSDALRSALMGEILKAVGGATVICLQPGPEDAEWVASQLERKSQLVQGLIPFISYQEPLPGEEATPGIAYYLPPLAATALAGEEERVTQVVQALRRGGLRAKSVRHLAEESAAMAAMLITMVAALETHHWQLAGFGRSDSARLGHDAALEAFRVMAHESSRLKGVAWLLRPWPLTVGIGLAAWWLPLPLERYLRYHFSKVGVQTRQMLDSYILKGQTMSLPIKSLEQLRALIA